MVVGFSITKNTDYSFQTSISKWLSGVIFVVRTQPQSGIGPGVPFRVWTSLFRNTANTRNNYNSTAYISFSQTQLISYPHSNRQETCHDQHISVIWLYLGVFFKILYGNNITQNYNCIHCMLTRTMSLNSYSNLPLCRSDLSVCIASIKASLTPRLCRVPAYYTYVTCNDHHNNKWLSQSGDQASFFSLIFLFTNH